jgi:hypothetical protein
MRQGDAFPLGTEILDVPTCPSLRDNSLLCISNNSILLDTWGLAYNNQCSQNFTII